VSGPPLDRPLANMAHPSRPWPQLIPSLGREANRLLRPLGDDEGLPARLLATAEIETLGGGPPALARCERPARRRWSASASAPDASAVRTARPGPFVAGRGGGAK